MGENLSPPPRLASHQRYGYNQTACTPCSDRAPLKPIGLVLGRVLCARSMHANINKTGSLVLVFRTGHYLDHLFRVHSGFALRW